MTFYPIPTYPVLIYPIPFYPIIKAIETYPILFKNPKQNILEQIKEPLIVIKELPQVHKISKQRKICLFKNEMSSKHERTEISNNFAMGMRCSYFLNEQKSYHSNST